MGEQEILIASGGGGVRYSSDGGENWSFINTGLPTFSGGFLRRVLTIAVNNSGLYCGVESSGVFKYNFENAEWEERNVGIDDITISTDFHGLFVNGTNVLIGTQLGNVYFSDDSGASFVNISTNSYVPTYDIAMNENHIFVARVGVRKLSNNSLYIYTSTGSATSEDLANSNAFKLYPNPSDGLVWLNSSKEMDNVTIKIIDVNGSIIAFFKEDLRGNVEVDLSAVVPGIYQVLIFKDGQFLGNRKLVKMGD